MNDPLIMKFVEVAETADRLGIDTSLDVPYVLGGQETRLIVRHSTTPLWNIFEFSAPLGNVRSTTTTAFFSVRCSGYNIAVDRYTENENLIRHMLMHAGSCYAKKIGEHAALTERTLQELFVASGLARAA